MSEELNRPEHNPTEPDAAIPGPVLPGNLGMPEVRPSIDLRPPQNGEEPPAWGWLDVLAVIGVFLLFWFVSGLVLAIVLIALKIKPEKIMDVRVLLPVQLVIYVVVFITIYLLVEARSKRPFWREIRWNWPSRNWWIYIPAGVVLAFAVGLVQSRLPIPKDIPMLKYLSNTGSAYAMGLLAVFGAPLIEELFFRGFLYPVMARWVRVWPSVVLIGFLFGLVHASQLGWAWGYVLILTFVGVVLTAVRAKTRSLSASFMLHTFYNTTLFVTMWFQTDFFRHMEKLSSALVLTR